MHILPISWQRNSKFFLIEKNNNRPCTVSYVTFLNDCLIGVVVILQSVEHYQQKRPKMLVIIQNLEHYRHSGYFFRDLPEREADLEPEEPLREPFSER